MAATTVKIQGNCANVLKFPVCLRFPFVSCEIFQVYIRHQSVSLSQNSRSHPYSALIPFETSEKRSLRGFTSCNARLFLLSMIKKRSSKKATNPHQLKSQMKLDGESPMEHFSPSSFLCCRWMKIDKNECWGGKRGNCYERGGWKIFFMSALFIFFPLELGQVLLLSWNGEPAKERHER